MAKAHKRLEAKHKKKYSTFDAAAADSENGKNCISKMKTRVEWREKRACMLLFSCKVAFVTFLFRFSFSLGFSPSAHCVFPFLSRNKTEALQKLLISLFIFICVFTLRHDALCMLDRYQCRLQHVQTSKSFAKQPTPHGESMYRVDIVLMHGFWLKIQLAPLGYRILKHDPRICFFWHIAVMLLLISAPGMWRSRRKIPLLW